MRAHDRDLTWLMGSGSSVGHSPSSCRACFFTFLHPSVDPGSNASGSKKITREDFNSAVFMGSAALSDGPWWCSQLVCMQLFDLGCWRVNPFRLF